MPWSSNGGGGQDGNGGRRGPWGQGPSKGPSGGRGKTPPDLEEIIRKSQERLKDIIPGGGTSSGVPWLIILVAIVALWSYNSVYRVQADEQGVVLRFGAYSRTTGPGLHFALWPVETVETPAVLRENNLNFAVSIARLTDKGKISR